MYVHVTKPISGGNITYESLSFIHDRMWTPMPNSVEPVENSFDNQSFKSPKSHGSKTWGKLVYCHLFIHRLKNKRNKTHRERLMDSMTSIRSMFPRAITPFGEKANWKKKERVHSLGLPVHENIPLHNEVSHRCYHSYTQQYHTTI